MVSSHSVGGGIAGGGSSKGAGLFTLDTKKNLSTIGLGADEDGKLARSGVSGGGAPGRRSYDFVGTNNNRSMTNLKLRQWS
jgi:hypothetical protein